MRMCAQGKPLPPSKSLPLCLPSSASDPGQGPAARRMGGGRVQILPGSPSLFRFLCPDSSGRRRCPTPLPFERPAAERMTKSSALQAPEEDKSSPERCGLKSPLKASRKCRAGGAWRVRQPRAQRLQEQSGSRLLWRAPEGGRQLVTHTLEFTGLQSTRKTTEKLLPRPLYSCHLAAIPDLQGILRTAVLSRRRILISNKILTQVQCPGLIH